MRKLLAIILTLSLFLLPALTGCYETTYDQEDNPTRPEDQQAAPPVESTPDTPAEEESGE